MANRAGMSPNQKALAVNGLVMPSDFPTLSFERTYAPFASKPSSFACEHFSAAWNAISFRFLAMDAEGDLFAESITALDASTSLERRYHQERHLFGFFSNGFSAFEAFFYGMFAVGAFLNPYNFPMGSAKEQRAINPGAANRAFEREFPSDPILQAFHLFFSDPTYEEWSTVRNILTHRTAPGRTIFVNAGTDRPLPPRWKLGNITLDESTLKTRRALAARMITDLIDASAQFVEARIT
jgi:hypothetical protein